MRKIIYLLRNINRMWLLLALAVVLGLAAAMLLSGYLKGREAALMEEAKSRASGGPTVEVVAAGVNIAKGATLSTQNLTKRAILADLVTEEMVHVSDFERVDGVKAARAIQAGRPLRVSDVIEKAKGIADTLEDGTRAITIEVDEINSMAQMVKPGNMVDLMLIVPDGSSFGDGQRVMLVMQGVKVLATGQRMASANGGAGSGQGRNDYGGNGGEAERYSNFTFEVSPKDAARIALAQQMGKIRAVLRGPGDEAIVELGDVTTRSMLRMAPATFSSDSAGPAPSGRPRSNPNTNASASAGSNANAGGSAGAGVAATTQRPKAVEYIIGGKGVATPVNINIPSLFPPSVADRNPFAAGPMAPQLNLPAGMVLPTAPPRP